MRKQLIVSAALASLLAGSALAQNSNSKTIDPDKMTTGATTNTGSKQTENAPAKFGTTQSGALMSSKVVGASVYNNQNEKIGEVEDLALDNGKTVNGIVVSVGGFLGIGEKYVLVEPSSISFRNDNGTWKAVMNTDKETLKSAPKFTYQADKS